MKEESEKAGLKLNSQEHKDHGIQSMTSWQIDWETMKTVTVFIFLGFKITADGDCSHAIKRPSLEEKLWQTDGILKSRDITLSTKVHLVKAMVFPIVMYRCESWNIKKAEHQSTDAFDLWCWRKLFKIPCNGRRANQSFLKKMSPEYSL